MRVIDSRNPFGQNAYGCPRGIRIAEKAGGIAASKEAKKDKPKKDKPKVDA